MLPHKKYGGARESQGFESESLESLESLERGRESVVCVRRLSFFLVRWGETTSHEDSVSAGRRILESAAREIEHGASLLWRRRRGETSLCRVVDFLIFVSWVGLCGASGDS